MSESTVPVAQRIERRFSKTEDRSLYKTSVGSMGPPSSDALDRCCISFVRHARTMRKQESTITIYQRSIRSLISVIGNKDVSDVTRDDIREWILTRNRQVSPTTTKIEYSAMRVFFHWLVDEEEISKSPCDRVVIPKEKDVPPPVYTTDEILSLLDAAKRHGSKFEQVRNTAIILLLLDCGMRRSEIAGCQVDDLDLDSRILLLRETKTGEPRVVPFGAKTALALDRYLRARNRHSSYYLGSLWLAKRGPLTGSGIGQFLKELGIDAGISGVRPHRFRHTFAHQASLNGMQMNDLMSIAGWKSVQMVVRYGRSAAVERAIASHRKTSPVDNL